MTRILAFLILLCLGAFPAHSQPMEVDVELALMVDVSRSMSPPELELQRRGYAEALVSDEGLGVVANGFIGKIAVTYVEWAGDGANTVIVPWTVIDGPESAQSVAARLLATFPIGLRRTSISGAIHFARTDLQSNDFEGLRRVIDVSGDGPNNDGRPVRRARDAAIEDGLVINGLPLMTWDEASLWGIPDLDEYYHNCVIGGPGAFVIPVLAWEDFPMAVRRKLVLELAGPMETVMAGFNVEPDFDCLIGEKIRREREIP
ncbi:MAG: DUF1194 domain-containing protein [Boseongicola sp.]|nr:DUF1194 domain-containing protein [Boseongicola sp.]